MNQLKDKNVNTLGYHPPISSAEYLPKFDTPNANWLTERTFSFTLWSRSRFQKY